MIIFLSRALAKCAGRTLRNKRLSEICKYHQKSSNMPKYVFIYFDAYGRGEISRLLFAAAGVSYENRLITEEEWPKLKERKMPSFLTGQVPCLEIDGKQVYQSLAIARYLAREFGMAGSDSMEQLKVDQVVETSSDLFTETLKLFEENDSNKKDEMRKKLDEETLPKFFRIYTTFLEENGDGSGYFVGSKMTMADLSFHDALTHFLQRDSKCLDKYPKLAAVIKSVETQPNIAQYLANRPKKDI